MLTVYPKKYAHGFCFAVFCCGYTLTDFPISIRLTSLACGNLTIAPVPAKQPWWIWINTSCEFIMNDCITTTKQSTTKPCAYFLGYTVYQWPSSIGTTCAQLPFLAKMVFPVAHRSAWRGLLPHSIPLWYETFCRLIKKKKKTSSHKVRP